MIFFVFQALFNSCSYESYTSHVRIFQALTMDSSVKKDMGQIVSLMSVDCQHLQDLFSYLSTLMSVPLQVAIGIYLLWDMFQISCLAGLAVLLLMVPLNSLVVTRQLHLTGSVLALKGERIKIMNQILNGIKVNVGSRKIGISTFLSYVPRSIFKLSYIKTKYVRYSFYNPL